MSVDQLVSVRSALRPGDQAPWEILEQISKPGLGNSNSVSPGKALDGCMFSKFPK